MQSWRLKLGKPIFPPSSMNTIFSGDGILLEKSLFKETQKLCETFIVLFV